MFQIGDFVEGAGKVSLQSLRWVEVVDRVEWSSLLRWRWRFDGRLGLKDESVGLPLELHVHGVESLHLLVMQFNEHSSQFQFLLNVNSLQYFNSEVSSISTSSALLFSWSFSHFSLLTLFFHWSKIV